MTPTDKMQEILRQELSKQLEADVERRLERPPGSAVYANWWEPGDKETAEQADLTAIRTARDSLKRDLARNDPLEMSEYAEQLITKHGLSQELLSRLTYGLLETAIKGWEVIEQRTLGLEPLIFTGQHSNALELSYSTALAPAPLPRPLASSLMDEFEAWARASGGWRQNAIDQAKASLQMFIEVTGDKPIDQYDRADSELLRQTLRQLPATYRKSAKDRDRPLAEIIADADRFGANRLSEKTIKRHFWAISRFFAFLIETGKLPRTSENVGRGFTFNTRASARSQRDMWTGEELMSLFASPIWTGRDAKFYTKAGNQIIRDAMFWRPLLGLYHGNRLEEFAQLRREDIQQQGGVWFIRITDDEGRQLKNEQSRRDVPIHSELIKIGFLRYVQEISTPPQDSLFPELKPGGRDNKLSYQFSKDFSYYRKVMGLKRKGLDYHSFRHGVTTKLYEAEVNEGWIDLLTGHQSGSESRKRYLKGIPLPSLKRAIDLVIWPEIDLSHLYITSAT